MLVLTVRFAQLAAVICNMDGSCITTRQIVYQPVDDPSSVSKSGLKSLSHLRFLSYASWWKNWALGGGVCIYTYPGGTPSITDKCAHLLTPGVTGGVVGGCGVGSGVCCLSCSGGGAPVPLCLQRFWGFCAVPFWPGRQPSVWFSWSIAGCLSITDFTFLCPGNSTPCILSSLTSAWGYLISNSVCSSVAHENPPLAILAIFKARHMSDCSSCTRPPCLAIVADMSKTYKKLVAASTYQIRLLPLSYTLP